MNPALFSLPEIILNDREEPDRTLSESLSSSDSFPLYQQLFPVSQEELDLYRLHEHASQRGRLERFCPSEPHLVTGEPGSPKALTVAEMLQLRASPDHREDAPSWTQRDSNQQCVPQPVPSLTGHTQPQAQDCASSLNTPPDVWPQTLDFGLRPLLPELIITPCSPQDSHWLNTCPLTPTPNPSGSTPYVLVPISSPPEFRLSPCLQPPSWLLVPEVRRSWCVCPQAVPVHQPCSPDMERAARQVGVHANVAPQSAVSGKQPTEGQDKSEEEAQKEYKLRSNNSDERTPKSDVPSGSFPSLDEELLAELAFEEYITIMDSMTPKTRDGAGTGENENTEGPVESFLQYLNEMCSDEDFVKEVESILDTEYLDVLVPPDPQPSDVRPLETQEQEVGSTLNAEDLEPSTLEDWQQILQDIFGPSSVAPATKETSLVEGTSQSAQAPIWDPPESQTDAHANSEDLKARDNGALALAPAATGDESEEATTSFSNLGDTRSAQTSQELQDGCRPVGPAASESPSTSRVSGSTEDPGTIDVKDPAPGFRADLSTVTPPEESGPSALSVLALKTLLYPLTNFSNLGTIPPADSCSPPVNVNLSDSVPDKETACEHLTSSEPDNAGAAATQKQTASREERTTKETVERKAENKETKLKGATKTRHSQRLLGQIEKEKAGQSGERTIERAEQRTPKEKSVKKTVHLTPKRDEVCEKQTRRSLGGRQLFKREESDFEERSPATKEANISEQFSEIGEEEHHQRRTVKFQKPEVEGGKQLEDKNPDVSADTGAENSHLSKTPQEEKDSGEQRKEGIQMLSFVRRRSRKSSPRMAKEDATEQQILLVPSPTKRSRNGGDKAEKANDAKDTCSTGRRTNKSSLQSPNVHTDTQHGPESPEEGQLDEITCEKTPDLTRPKVQRQSRTAALSGGSNDGRRGEVTGAITRDLRSQTELKKLGIRENKAAEGTRQPAKREPTRGANDERINREEAERPSLASSPMKRYRNERSVSEESQERGEETETEITSFLRRRSRKSSPKKAKEDATEQQILLVPSPTKRSRSRGDRAEKANDAKDTCSTGCRTDKYSLQSPNVHTDTRRGPESPEEGQLDEITCEKTPDLTRLKAQRLNRTAAFGGGGADGRRGEAITRNLRSQTELKKLGIRENKANEGTRQPAKREPTRGANDERINREEEECLSLASSPMKRYRNERGVYEESQERGEGTETEITSFVRGRSRKSSPKKAKGDATEQQILLVPSPTKRSRSGGDRAEKANDAKDTCSTGRRTDKSSLQSPNVHTDTQRGPESPEEGQLDEITCEKTPDLTHSKVQRQSRTAALSGVGADERLGEVTGAKTRNLRSQTESKKLGIQENKAAEGTRQPAKREPTTGANDERINREEAERPSLASSPMKRYRIERGVYEESQERGEETETEITSTSPMKRGRWKRGALAAAERDGDKDEAGTSSCKATRSSTKAKDATAGGDTSGATATRTSREKTCGPRRVPPRRQTRLSKDGPAKYKDFVLGKTSRRQLDKEKVRKSQRGRRKTA